VGAGAVEEALHIEIDDLKAKLKAETAERTKQVCVCVCVVWSVACFSPPFKHRKLKVCQGKP